MYGIVSLLDQDHQSKVHDIWADLAERCGVRYILDNVPLPHFTWQGGDAYDFEAVSAALAEFTAQTSPFRVKTTGIGFFTGEIPVMYVAVVRDSHLTAIHERLWAMLAPHTTLPSMYYAPPNWTPHITLAQKDILIENVGCAMANFLEKPIVWDILVDQVSIVGHQPDEPGEVLRTFSFRGGDD